MFESAKLKSVTNKIKKLKIKYSIGVNNVR